MKTKKRKEKKDTPKNEFIIEENHQQFSRIFTNNVVAKNESKKKIRKKNIKQKKEKPCNPKKQKRNVFLDRI
jgi:hypothetical protein